MLHLKVLILVKTGKMKILQLILHSKFSFFPVILQTKYQKRHPKLCQWWHWSFYLLVLNENILYPVFLRKESPY